MGLGLRARAEGLLVGEGAAAAVAQRVDRERALRPRPPERELALVRAAAVDAAREAHFAVEREGALLLEGRGEGALLAGTLHVLAREAALARPRRALGRVASEGDRGAAGAETRLHRERAGRSGALHAAARLPRRLLEEATHLECADVRQCAGGGELPIEGAW